MIEEPRIDGVGAGEYYPDEEEVLAKAEAAWHKTEQLMTRRRNQRIEFDSPTICLVAVADLHFGGPGVDYPRAFAEAELIADMPNTWLITVGDMVDNFIVGKLVQQRLKAEFSIAEEWALVRRYLRIVADKLILAVAGNHDQWTMAMSGLDYFGDVLEQLDQNQRCIYNRHRALAEIVVDGWPLLARVQHKWRGSSIYNPTHGIERAAKFDHPFDLGLGAHIHRGGLARQFICRGRTAMALLAGTYKRVDDYALQQGFAQPNEAVAVAVILDAETHTMTGYNSLERAAAVMANA